MNKDDLFSLAPRQAGEVEIGDTTFKVKALDLDGRFKLGEQSDLSVGERFAWMCINGCEALKDCSVQEVIDNLDHEAMAKIAAKIMELSGLGDEEEKAQKKSESKQS